MKNKNNNDWKVYKVSDTIKIIPLTNKKIKQSDYLKTGKLPIIDQGLSLIGGFTNDVRKKLDCGESAIVFGDHTKILKFINFDFTAGADGIKVFTPKIKISTKLLYHLLSGISLPEKGYSRYFQYLQRSSISIPPEKIQPKIIKILDKAEKIVQLKKQFMIHLNELMFSAYSEIILKNKSKPKTLEELKVDFSMGGTPETNNPAYFNGDIDWVNGSDIKREFIYSVDTKISEEGKRSKNMQTYPTGTILIGRVGQGKTRGMTAILRNPMTANESMIAILPNSKLLPEYFHFNLKMRYAELRNFGGDNRRGTINQTNLRNLEVIVPSMPIQENFARIVKKYEKLKLSISELEIKKNDPRSLYQSLIQETLSKKIT
ncbi:MAG: restriction endonuclease subunit S [Nitrosarchaeum sp.]|jgi:type I restriction enzyme S subunit|uniref:restriction endonuclease subunit S n=1 Tax=Nitrosarchaeum sp. TaxID=2026886 RepID=UPI002DE5E93E|nr:restriction endonuclease subunit S [Nitrosarchaeum sp.]MEC4848713.1 restriction endonuclease subunit S [Nitrosarchaeum sp.]